MVTLKKFNLSGSELGTCELAPEIVEDLLTANRSKITLWLSGKIKGNGTPPLSGEAKLAIARRSPTLKKVQGALVKVRLLPPSIKGGGRPMGPKPKFDQHVKINKERKEPLSAPS